MAPQTGGHEPQAGRLAHLHHHALDPVASHKLLSPIAIILQHHRHPDLTFSHLGACQALYQGMQTNLAVPHSTHTAGLTSANQEDNRSGGLEQ
jgi:hypothetical protein